MSSSQTTRKPFEKDGRCRILSLDGGGAKGFYALGVLKEVEAMMGVPLHQCFDLIFGTSTGSIIGALIALGKSVDEIHELYKAHVPTVMSCRTKAGKSAALATLADTIFEDAKFTDVKTNVGIVATKWDLHTPMIFKGNPAQAHGRQDTFVPGFGVKISDAVQASCSAYPFFERKVISTSNGNQVELIDGGYCANNPTLYAIADALKAMEKQPGDLRVLSVGVGVYPDPGLNWLSLSSWWKCATNKLVSVQLLQKTLEVNTESMEQLRKILCKDVKTVRVSDTYREPTMATDLLEHDLAKLNRIRQRGAESYASREAEIKALLQNEPSST
jgi:patatin-like phospholipase/acyl hydrolase